MLQPGLVFLIILLVLPVMAGLYGLWQARTARRLSDRIAGLLLFLLVLTLYPFGLLIGDALSAAKSRAWLDVCHRELRCIGDSLLLYRQENGLFPQAITEVFKGRRLPRCPGPKGLGAEYFYRSSAPDDRNAVVCWDRAPHEIRHTIFWFRNKTLRNTLRANGMVETVTEAEFRGLGLSE